MKCVKRSLSKRIDKSYNDKFYSDNKKLMNILRDGEQYGKKQPHQEYAQAALKEFYKKLKSTSERKEYINRFVIYVFACKCKTRIYENGLYMGVPRIARHIAL